jgi:hypothetical protein
MTHKIVRTRLLYFTLTILILGGIMLAPRSKFQEMRPGVTTSVAASTKAVEVPSRSVISSQAVSDDSRVKGEKRTDLTLDELILRNIKAEGGSRKTASLRSYVTEGIRIENRKTSRFIEFRQAPNRLFAKEYRSSSSNAYGYDGAVGWTAQTDLGVKEVTGIMLDVIRRNALALNPFQMREVYSKMTLREKANLLGRDIYVVDAEVQGGSPEVLYFDGKTFLLFREDALISIPTGQEVGRWEFEDFRVVSGIKMPFQKTLILGDREIMRDFVTKIEPDPHIDMERFVMPKSADIAVAR